MSALEMIRKASDNRYLHRDFHCTLNGGLVYLEEHYGREGVERYLRAYARSRYEPMTLEGLRAYFEKIYADEECPEYLSTSLSGGRLSVKVLRCPGLEQLRRRSEEPAGCYEMTTGVLYDELAKICGLEFELISYDKAGGAAEFAFREASR